MTVTVQNRPIHYIDEGQGAPVLLLHGWGAKAETYRLIINHLSARCRVVAPDLPGFGDSPAPERPWTPQDYVDFVCAFCEAVSLQPQTVIGHSNGGRILLWLMSRQPCPLPIEKAVLIDAAGLKPHRSLGYYVKVYSFKALKNTIGRICPSLVDKARRRLGSADYRAADGVMRQTMTLALNTDVRPHLSKITVPTLLIWGEKDTATPLADAKVMQKLIPDAGLVTVPNAGHFSFAEDWPRCRAVLDAFV